MRKQTRGNKRSLTVKLSEQEWIHLNRLVLSDRSVETTSEYVRRWIMSQPTPAGYLAAGSPPPLNQSSVVKVTRDRCSPFAPCGLDGCDRNCARRFLQPDQM